MEIDDLLRLPESYRDKRWELQFFDAFLRTNVQIQEDVPQAGPDGMPYLLVKTSPEAREPLVRVLDWLKSRGIGLVVNAHKMAPDYVFTYGMIWNYFTTGKFMEPNRPARASGEVVYTGGEGLVTGQPSEQYLPEYVRVILREFLKAKSYASPRVLVVSDQKFERPDLIFSLESLGGVAGKSQRELAEQLGWFLPLHYSLVFAAEKDWPQFFAL